MLAAGTDDETGMSNLRHSLTDPVRGYVDDCLPSTGTISLILALTVFVTTACRLLLRESARA
jgi:hypothetical protein